MVGPSDGWTDKPFGPSPASQGVGHIFFAVAHPTHVSISHTKFSSISSNGLGGDSVIVRRTDGRGDYSIPIDFFFKKRRGDNNT